MKFTLHTIILLTVVLSAQMFCSKAFSFVANCPESLTHIPPTIKLSNKANKNLRKSPPQVQNKFNDWSKKLKEEGLGQVRINHQNSFRDERLRFSKLGDRSIRLNRAYRAIYNEEPSSDGGIRLFVVDINKHRYD